MLDALTRNLGSRRTGEAWLRSRLGEGDAPDVVFAQEALPSLVTDPPSGYQLVAGREEPNGAVGRLSVLLIKDELETDEQVPDGDARPFGGLGTYAATSILHRGDRSIWLVSIHTSPAIVPPAKRRPDFLPRSCERDPWWADAFLAELRSFVSRDLGVAVIAGDLNQARAYDKALGHVCGGELLDGVAAAGFVDVTSRDWEHVERPTRQNPDYQLDRVFASESVAKRVSVDTAALQHDGASDHAAVRFSLDF